MIIFSTNLYSEQASANTDKGAQKPQIFYDADKISGDVNRQIFSGNVVAIAAGVLITADKIEVNRADNLINGQGNIFILTKSIIFAGSSVTYNMKTGDFKLEQAFMVANDTKEVELLTKKLLGINQEEIEFEAERQKRLREIELAKADIKSLFRNPLRPEGQSDEQIIQAYTTLLQKEDHIKNQLNGNLAKMSAEKRGAFQRRREVWENSKHLAQYNKSGTYNYYFRIDGGELTRVNGNDYAAKDALFTPCLCNEDESPDWGFRAARIDAQMEGYADLYHPVLEINGIPILYIPYLKIPLKDERQSGFILPSFAYSRDSGSVYSQPLFFAWDQSSDSTVTTDFIEKRGVRLGLEYRKKIRTHSGFSFNFETLRDSQWITDVNNRRDMEKTYILGLEEAKAKFDTTPKTPAANPDAIEVNDYEWWDGTNNKAKIANCLASDENTDQCIQEINSGLAQPDNAWRGRLNWGGGVFLAPRLLFVSEGEITSDHRYSEDLGALGRSFEALLTSSYDYRSFNKSKVLTHLDAKDFYLGLGATYGDPQRMSSRFAGHQIPALLKIQTRMVPVLGDDSSFPIYFQTDYEAHKITSGEEKTYVNQDNINSLEYGLWQRLRGRFLVPLVNEQVFLMNYFADVENRNIKYKEKENKVGKIFSWKTGLNFELPLDGSMKIGESEYQDEILGKYSREKYIQHNMTWGLTLSTRPVVARDDEYGKTPSLENSEGKPDPNSERLTFYSSDRTADLSQYDFAPDEESMFLHKKIGLYTRHSWSLFDKGWSLIPAAVNPKVVDIASVEIKERARQELLFSLDREEGTAENIVDEQNNWFINRYQLQEFGQITPLNFYANISYDFYQKELLDQAKPVRRQTEEDNTNLEQAAVNVLKNNPDDPIAQSQAANYRSQKRKIDPLPEPWSLLTTRTDANLAGWTLVNYLDYNVSRKVATKVNFTLGLPSFFATNIGLGYEQTIASTADGLGGFNDTRERSRFLNLVSGLIPHVNTIVSLTKKVTDTKQVTLGSTHAYKTVYGIVYQDPSDCWGIQFSRQKAFEVEEKQASYNLALTVKFLGHSRPLPDMSPSLRKNNQQPKG